MWGIVLSALHDFRRTWRQLIAIDLVYKLLTLAVIWPVLGFSIRAFIATSGSAAVSDLDILFFILSPIGLVTMLAFLAFGLTAIALEQACLMTISNEARNVHPSALAALLSVSRLSLPVLRVSFRLVTRVLILSAPFLAFGGCIHWILLTEFDINYYLTFRPPAFWTAAALLGIDLVVMAVVLVPQLVSWSFALPLVLFEGETPRKALQTSAERTAGHRWTIARIMLGWAAACVLISAISGVTVVFLARSLVPFTRGSIEIVAIVIGAVVLLWILTNFAVMFVQVASFAVLTTRLYEVLGQPSHGQIDRRITEAVEEPDQQPGLSLARLVLGLAAAAVVATSLGAWLLHSVRMEDNVLVIAHRGGAKVAPENTIAAFTRAIQDGADQVELDVQETADGEVVVIHDSDLMKIAGVDLRIWDATLEQIGEIDIGSHFSVEFRDQRIPRLADALQLCKGKVTVNIELKYYGHDKQLEQRVAEIVEAAGMESQIVAMSLEYEAVQKMKLLRPKWTVGLLTATAIGDVTKLDADFLAVSSSMASRQFIRRARGRRKPVYVWTVNDPIQLSRMISMGVDGVITDEPGLARSVLARRAQMSPVERLLINLAFWIGAVPNGAAAAPQ